MLLWDMRHCKQPVATYAAPCLEAPESIVWGRFSISNDERILYSSKGDQLCAWSLLDGRLLSHCDGWNGAVLSSMLLADGLPAPGLAGDLGPFPVEGFLCPHTSVALQYHPLLGLYAVVSPSQLDVSRAPALIDKPLKRSQFVTVLS